MATSDLIYQLEDTPPLGQTILASAQHVLASFVGIITATLIIGAALGLQEHVSYLISMSLVVTGVATFIQARPIGPVGDCLVDKPTPDPHISGKGDGHEPASAFSDRFGRSQSLRICREAALAQRAGVPPLRRH